MKTDENEKTRVSGTLTLLLLIILSLLIHLLFFGTFLKYGFKSRAKIFFTSISNYLTGSEKKEIQAQIEKKHEAIRKIFQSTSTNRKPKSFLFNKQKKQINDLPAKLVAPKSNFGWVIFEDQHEQPKNLEIPNTKQGDVGTSKHAHATETKPEKNIVIQQQPLIKKESKPEPKLESKVENKATIAAETKKMASVSIKNNEQTEPNASKAAKPSEEKNAQEDVQKRIEEIEKIQKQIENYTNREPQKTAPETPQEPEREMTKEEEKNMILSSMLCKDKNNMTDQSNASSDFVWGAGGKKNENKNLIKLTKGYIEKLHGENGTDLIDRDGDPNKKPSFEELKYISYESKINWCLQSSWKNNFSHNQAFPISESKAVIEFTLDESGKVIKHYMLQSTGYKEVDIAIIKNLEFASPFPPLPKHFGTKTYTTGRSITVYAQRFGL